MLELAFEAKMDKDNKEKAKAVRKVLFDMFIRRREAKFLRKGGYSTSIL